MTTERPYIASIGGPEWGAHVMEHVRGRWRGRAYTLAGVARTTWDTDNYEGPTHWEPVE